MKRKGIIYRKHLYQALEDKKAGIKITHEYANKQMNYEPALYLFNLLSNWAFYDSSLKNTAIKILTKYVKKMGQGRYLSHYTLPVAAYYAAHSSGKKYLSYDTIRKQFHIAFHTISPIVKKMKELI